MKYAWQVLSFVLLGFCVAAFCYMVDYDNKVKELERTILDKDKSYKELTEDYIELSGSIDVFTDLMMEVEEYIAWKKVLTAKHSEEIPKIEITSEDRIEFWNNFYMFARQ